MYVYAHIINQLAEEWTLPASAVIKQAEEAYCFFIEGGKAVRVRVQAGRSDGKFIQVARFHKPGTSQAWMEWTGNEKVAARAAGLSDGQAMK